MTSNAKSKVFRVTGLPIGEAEHDVQSTLAQRIYDLLSDDEEQLLEVQIACVPSCDESKTSSALVEFRGGTPQFLSQLDRDPLRDWQVEMGDEDINFDRHFFGFTQLYTTDPRRPITAEYHLPSRTGDSEANTRSNSIVAITGLDGHAYGSWRGKGNLGRMWLRDFLSKDLPQCRTMIYGYNSKLLSRGVDTIMDYGREFLEGIKRVKYTKELSERPLIFIAHSFGRIIVSHCLVKAMQMDERDHATIAALHKATYGILFFGTPHKGLLIDDIKQMVVGDNDHPRTELLEQINVKSDLLMYQLVDFKNLTRDWKIVSFYDTQQTKQLIFNPETQSWSRSGVYITAVTSDSAILQLPDSIEVKILVNADHSQIVKFDNKNTHTYQIVLGYLKQFEKDARNIISSRFGIQQRKGVPKSTIPFNKDRKCVGRQDILTVLGSYFSQMDTHNRVALVGLGGVGKSQIAIEYSYRLREQDPQTWVFWVHGGNAVKFEQAYRSIAVTLQLPGWDDPKADILDVVARWLSDVDNGRWLMILDNADDIEVFRQTREESSQNHKAPQHAITLAGYIPQTATGSVLITTRDRRVTSWLSSGYQSILIELMDKDEAKSLLRTRIPASLSTELDLEDLVGELGYLPLAITQAAAYISVRATRMTVSKYLSLYRQSEENQSRLLDEDLGDLRRDPGVPNSVIRTWQISFDQIKRTNPRAAELLSLMAMLDRQGIPESLLSATDQNALDFEDALSSLHEFSLIIIENGGKSFEMHRLVQLATRKWLEQRMEIHKWQEEAMDMLSKAFPDGDYSNWGICRTLLPHAQEVLRCKPASDDHFLARGSLLYSIAWYSWAQGRYSNAREQIRESLAIRERLLEDFHISIFRSAELFGLVLRAQGKYAEAEAMNRRALAGKETALGPEHPNTLTSVNNLAAVLQAQGKYAEAEAMNRRALAGREMALGPEHPNTLMSVSDLAYVFRAQGKYAEAETMSRRALAGCETALGPEHPDTLTSVSDLAGVLQAQGKYAEAEAMNRRALAGYETVLGPEHPNTLTSVYCLAYLFHGQGKYTEASILYQRAYNGYTKSLGHNHPTTLACSKHYSSMLEERDRGQISTRN